jgi:acyl-coenzyme A synthetase/AMP-(fatty) acid ligase
MSLVAECDLSPTPILDAVENYAGSFVDLAADCTTDAAALRVCRDRFAASLRKLGVRPGDRIIYCAGNGPAFVAGLAAALSVGGSPLLVHAKTPPPELKRTALRYGARLAILDDCTSVDLPTALGQVVRLSEVEGLQLYAASIDPGLPGFDADYLGLPGAPLHPTSGTTGLPKVAVRPARAATEEARHYIETMGITAADAILAVAPMCHAYAYGMCVMVPLLSNARVVSLRGFEPSLVLQAMGDGRVTIFPAVPAMLDVLSLDEWERPWKTARCVLSAGSALTERTANRFRERSGLTVRPLYGTTETGGITVAPADGIPVLGHNVGPAMDGVDVQIVPDSAGSDAPPGVGRLLVRSSSMMAGYLGRSAIDTSVLVDGCFDTGDLASIDANEQIHLMGRESEVINVEGSKVIPCEVEEVIASLPGVLEVKVYAGRRRNGGQFVKAAVVSEPHVDAESIAAHCERNLVYYKCPERILPVGALPRSATGKILRDQLP